MDLLDFGHSFDNVVVAELGPDEVDGFHFSVVDERPPPPLLDEVPDEESVVASSYKGLVGDILLNRDKYVVAKVQNIVAFPEQTVFLLKDLIFRKLGILQIEVFHLFPVPFLAALGSFLFLDVTRDFSFLLVFLLFFLVFLRQHHLLDRLVVALFSLELLNIFYFCAQPRLAEYFFRVDLVAWENIQVDRVHNDIMRFFNQVEIVFQFLFGLALLVSELDGFLNGFGVLEVQYAGLDV